MKRQAITVIALIFLLTGSYNAKAQTFEDEPLYDQLKNDFQKDYLRIGSLL